MQRMMLGWGGWMATFAALCGASLSCSGASGAMGQADADGGVPVVVKPVLETEPVPNDPDDPAIWISPTDPSRSLILATDKQELTGGLYIFGLDGRTRQVIAPLDRPNNVDVEYGVRLGDETFDIAVLTERMQHRLRIFAIPSDGGALRDLAPEGLTVLEGEAGEASEPMGIAIYKRPADHATFLIVSPKTGPTVGYLWQYRLEADGNGGGPRAVLVRRFGSFSGLGPSADEAGEIEAVVVDDRRGYVYYSDEQFGIRKWHADPDATDADVEIAVLGRSGYTGDREGLAIYERPGDAGFLVSSDQIDGGSRLQLYRRGPAEPETATAIVETAADATDGLEATAHPLPGFPAGLLVTMNSSARTFQLYSWEDVLAALHPDGS